MVGLQSGSTRTSFPMIYQGPTRAARRKTWTAGSRDRQGRAAGIEGGEGTGTSGTCPVRGPWVLPLLEGQCATRLLQRLLGGGRSAPSHWVARYDGQGPGVVGFGSGGSYVVPFILRSP